MTKPLLSERRDAVAVFSINDAPYNRMTIDFVDQRETSGTPDQQEGMMAFLEKRKPVVNQPPQ